MGQGRPFHAKLYLEGVEVPFIGATITHTVNQASIAYIDLVPHKHINNIKPRTHVLLTMRDFNNPHNGYPFIQMWEGEVFGYDFGRTTKSRTFTISCIDYTSYWDNTLLYFFNARQSLGKGAEAIGETALSANDALAQGIRFESVTHSKSSYFRQEMEKEVDEGGDFLDAFIRLYKRIVNVNEFYKLAEDRLRIIERIVLRSSGKLFDLLEKREGLDWFEKIAGRRSGFSTLRKTIQDLMGIIFHDSVTVPFAGRVDSDNLEGDPLPSSENEKKTVGNFIFKPNMYMIPPPSCNIFFPDEYSSFQYKRSFFKEPSRLIYKPELPRIGSQGGVALPHAYEPASFNNYMKGEEDWEDFKGAGSFDVSGDKYTSDFKFNGEAEDTEINPKLREGDFLTNEEKIKGIWLAQESLVPAATQFTESVKQSGKRRFIKRIAKYLFYKKRYENRRLQITSHLKPSVVPGFNALIVDDSEAEHHVMAYCSSVTHRIYATEGGHTNVSLSYARSVDEQDVASNRGDEPLIPPWYDETVFGKFEIDEDGNKVMVSGDGLSQFYESLLGKRGSTAITHLYKNKRSLKEAADALLAEYKSYQEAGGLDLHTFIIGKTSRDYIHLKHAFEFLGAKTKTKTTEFKDQDFTEFRGDRYQAKGKDNEQVVKDKRTVIENYRNSLKRKRGFRG